MKTKKPMTQRLENHCQNLHQLRAPRAKQLAQEAKQGDPEISGMLARFRQRAEAGLAFTEAPVPPSAKPSKKELLRQARDAAERLAAADLLARSAPSPEAQEALQNARRVMVGYRVLVPEIHKVEKVAAERLVALFRGE